MSKVVITYFEPFGERTTNASKEVVSLFNQYQIKELPVSWNKVPFTIDELLIDEPDYLFLIGEAGSYKDITIERTAHNVCNGKDNDGVNKDNEEILKGDKDIKTTLSDLSNLPYRISDDAGKYLCNYTYYLALSKVKTCKVLFVHLPYTEESGPNSLDNLRKDLLNIIETLAK